MTPSFFLAMLFATFCLVIGIWDTYIVAFAQTEDTVSTIIRGWVHEYPILAFALGVIVGHVFW